MKNSNLLLLVLLIFIAVSVNAQKNLKPARVVLSDQSVLEGFIDYQQWGANPASIRFMPSENAKPTVYYPNEVLHFEVGDDYYASAVVPVELSPNEIARLTDSAGFILQTDTVFLLRIYKGTKSLWSFHNPDIKVNYYISTDGDYQLLEYKRYNARSDRDYRIVKENKKFIGQLTLSLSDCKDISGKINKVSYAARSLIKLLKAYDQCVGLSSEYEIEDQPGLRLKLGLLAGISVSTIRFNSNSPAHKSLVETDFASSLKPTGGLALDMILPRNRQKWIFRNELVYSSVSFKDTWTQEKPEANTKEEIYNHMEFSWLKLNSMLRFAYPVSSLRIFVNVGLSNAFVVDEINEKKRDWYVYEQHTVTEGKAITYTRSYEQSWLIGAGLKTEHFGFEMRYSKSNGISDVTALGSSISRMNFYVSYIF